MDNSEKEIKVNITNNKIKKKIVSVKPDNENRLFTPRLEMTDGLLIPNKNNNSIFNAWRFTFAFAIFTLTYLVIFVPDPYRQIFLVVIKGLPMTFQVTIFAILGSLFIGLFVGLGSVSKNRFINMLAGVYVEFIRGIPLLVQLIFIYYAMGRIFQIEGIFAATIALSICFGAYMGEIVRAGIQAIPRGQMEAAIALGLSRGQAFRYVIIPQTIKVILPAIGNEFISMLKDSSLVSTIALSDILRKGREYISRTFLSLETMFIVALVYLVITLLLSRLVGMLEERLHKNG